MTRLLAVCLLLISASACAPVINSDFVRTSGESFSALANHDSIPVLDGASISRAYKVLGFVSATGFKGTPQSLMLEEMRKKAANAGGNALVDLKVNDWSTPLAIRGTYTNYNYEKLTATVIRYTD